MADVREATSSGPKGLASEHDDRNFRLLQYDQPCVPCRRRDVRPPPSPPPGTQACGTESESYWRTPEEHSPVWPRSSRISCTSTGWCVSRVWPRQSSGRSARWSPPCPPVVVALRRIVSLARVSRGDRTTVRLHPFRSGSAGDGRVRFGRATTIVNTRLWDQLTTRVYEQRTEPNRVYATRVRARFFVLSARTRLSALRCSGRRLRGGSSGCVHSTPITHAAVLSAPGNIAAPAAVAPRHITGTVCVAPFVCARD